jgi:hypothetical protein
MKILSTIFLTLLLCSCYNTDRETNQLNQRITHLEQRMDSLINAQNSYPGGSGNMNTIRENGRCQGMTKKGIQCKRKPKSNSYCWQHGG